MTAIQQVFRNPNPRLALAVPCQLDAPVEPRFAAPIAPVQSAGLGALTPAEFVRAAAQLDDHRRGRVRLLDPGLSCADFRMGAFLPRNRSAGLRAGRHPPLSATAVRPAALSARADPGRGMDLPDLPPVPDRLPPGE